MKTFQDLSFRIPLNGSDWIEVSHLCYACSYFINLHIASTYDMMCIKYIVCGVIDHVELITQCHACIYRRVQHRLACSISELQLASLSYLYLQLLWQL